MMKVGRTQHSCDLSGCPTATDQLSHKGLAFAGMKRRRLAGEGAPVRRLDPLILREGDYYGRADQDRC